MRVNAEINFECSHCGQKLCVEAAACGVEIACPSCHSTLIVPSEAHGFLDNGSHAPGPGVDHELIAVREQLIEATMSRGRLERDVAGYQVELEALQKQLRALEDQRDALVYSLEESRAETQRLANELDGSARELERVRSRCASLETEKEVEIRTAEGHRKELERKQARVTELEGLVGDLQPKLKAAQKEARVARKDVEASADAKKARKLREDIEKAEAVQASLREELSKLKEEHAELGRHESALRQEKDGWQERCQVAERKVQTLSESQLQKDNTVLRSILERQKVEMELRFKELKRLRRAQLGLRLGYVLFGLGIVVLVLIVIPRIKDLSDWFTE